MKVEDCLSLTLVKKLVYVMEGQCLNPNNIMEAAAASGQAAAGSLLVSVLVPVEARLQLHHSAPALARCPSSVQFTLTTTLGYCDMTASDCYLNMVLNAIKFARYIINTHFQIYHSPTQSNPQSVISFRARKLSKIFCNFPI